jgi:HB1, ASXL, restriction endonuclease HTH domain
MQVLQNKPWLDAIIEVLKDAKEPMTPAEIADSVIKRELRTELGATPSATVGSKIYTSLKADGAESPFIRAGKALFSLRTADAPKPTVEQQKVIEKESVATTSETTGLVNAFGMFWERSKADWALQPPLLGQQFTGATVVNFCNQRGVYLLHDTQGVVYVGRVTNQSMGHRLFEHTKDRLGGRWSRFSWFGVYGVEENGALKAAADFSAVDVNTVIITMEAVLIEGLEPRQNRKRGDDFSAVEFVQVEDPKLEKQRKLALMHELTAKL